MLRDKKPDRILINRDFFDVTLADDEKKSKQLLKYVSSRNTAISLFISALTSGASLYNIWGTEGFWKTVFIILTIIFSVVTIYDGIKAVTLFIDIRSRKDGRIADVIYEKIEKETRYTALIVICYQDKRTGKMRYLTERTGNYIAHCNMNPASDAYGQKERIINYLINTYDINIDHFVGVMPLSEEVFYCIKPVHDEIKMNGFIFYQIRLKKSAKQNLANHRNATWLTLDEMKLKPELMGINKDVVTAIEENASYISDSFVEPNGSLHIIWNITNTCNYHCAICATFSNCKKELELKEKLKVLEHIQSYKRNIAMLDFAGGDPLTSADCQSVVNQAIHSMGEDHISITTTGSGVEKLGVETRRFLLTRCEVTIDASHENLSPKSLKSKFSRQEKNYNKKNYEQIKLAADSLRILVLNIPIIDDDLSDEEIEVLLEKILKLKKDNPLIEIKAQLIRLMPVGHFAETYSKADYRSYNPISVAKKIYERIEETGINCRFHCSLRILPELYDGKSYCNMLNEKIGIDCSGNVFACAWAAYLPADSGNVEDNPFYLGNLVRTDLKSIIEEKYNDREQYRRINKMMVRRADIRHCGVVSWYMNPSLDENCDPLSGDAV